MKKKILFTFLACGLILATACGKKEDPTNNGDNGNNGGNTNQPAIKEPTANTETNVITETTIDGLTINNISLITEGTGSTFTADVVNTTDQEVNVKSFNIILKDADGNEVVTLLGYIGTTIAPNDSATMSTGVEMDLTNVKSVEYVRNY